MGRNIERTLKMRRDYERICMEAKKQGYPKYFESDLICNLCGEPWDTWGTNHGDMTALEVKKFLKGKGCPICQQTTK